MSLQHQCLHDELENKTPFSCFERFAHLLKKQNKRPKNTPNHFYYASRFGVYGHGHCNI